MRCACEEPTCRPCSVQKWARELQARPHVILDTETTGLGHDAEVIQIGIVDARGVEVFSTLIRPQQPINESGQAYATNQISNKMLDGAPTFPEVYSALRFWMCGSIIVAYNSDFDRRMLSYMCERYNLSLPDSPWECAMLKYAAFVGEPGRGKYKTHNLKKACGDMGVTIQPTHQAVADCIATWHLLQAMAGQTPNPPLA